MTRNIRILPFQQPHRNHIRYHIVLKIPQFAVHLQGYLRQWQIIRARLTYGMIQLPRTLRNAFLIPNLASNIFFHVIMYETLDFFNSTILHPQDNPKKKNCNNYYLTKFLRQNQHLPFIQ